MAWRCSSGRFLALLSVAGSPAGSSWSFTPVHTGAPAADRESATRFCPPLGGTPAPHTHAAGIVANVAGRVGLGALAGLGASAAALSLHRGRRRKAVRRRAQVGAATIPRPLAAVVKGKYSSAFENARRFDFSCLGDYPICELEELYIDASWVANEPECQPLISSHNFQELKKVLREHKSSFPDLLPSEVTFVEASISYYRGEPILSDEEYDALKMQVTQSGRRKDATAFLLSERSQQSLTDKQRSNFQQAFKLATYFDFDKLESYTLGELEELYIDALWCYYNDKRSILSDGEFSKLKQVLYKLGSNFPTLTRQEVAFVEASIAYYRGEPIVSDEEYAELKAVVQDSGRRKDVTAFLLYERGERFLDDDSFVEMKVECEKLGMPPVDIDQCNLAQLEEMYVEALWAYYHDNVQLLSDDQYNKLKQELQWRGSGFPTLRDYEIDFVKASLSYWQGKPVASDEEWRTLKSKVLTGGRRSDVTAFLLYSKGQQVLDAETFDAMRADMEKLGLRVQKAGTKALERTLSVTSDRLTNDLGEVARMFLALGLLPTLLSVTLTWLVVSSLDVLAPETGWMSFAKREVWPSILVGGALGVLLSQQLVNFLGLQSPAILSGVCPSCTGDIKLFTGGPDPNVRVGYTCPSCGCNMVLNTSTRKIESAGLGSKIKGVGVTLTHSSGAVTFEQREITDGVIAWSDSAYAYREIPKEMLRSKLFAGPHRTAPGVLTLATEEPGTVYIWGDMSLNGGFPNLSGWTSVGMLKWEVWKCSVFKSQINAGQALQIPISRTLVGGVAFLPVFDWSDAWASMKGQMRSAMHE